MDQATDKKLRPQTTKTTFSEFVQGVLKQNEAEQHMEVELMLNGHKSVKVASAYSKDYFGLFWCFLECSKDLHVAMLNGSQFCTTLLYLNETFQIH